VDAYQGFMEDLGFHKALIAVWEVIGRVNKYIDTMAPWVLAKSRKDRLAPVMNHIMEALRIIAGLLWPFMPETAEKIQSQLGYDKRGGDVRLSDLRQWGCDRPSRPVSQAPALFPRIETDPGKVPSDRKTRTPSEVEGQKADRKEMPLISFDDFQKVELRVGTVKAAEAVPKSKKLIKLTVDIGEERTVVAGILGHYSAETLVGRQVIVAANLEPVKLMGVESKGMVLAAEDESGVHLLTVDADVVPGSRIK
jgi:methionyl-tRNA synthetase